jgi:hypothetical protein
MCSSLSPTCPGNSLAGKARLGVIKTNLAPGFIGGLSAEGGCNEQ